MKNLQKIREDQNMSQQDLADATGIRRAYVGLLERGRAGSVPAAFAIADALGVPVDSLYRDTR